MQYTQDALARAKNVKMLILDEADEMLDMGFIEDIEEIMSNVAQGENRQTFIILCYNASTN